MIRYLLALAIGIVTGVGGMAAATHHEDGESVKFIAARDIKEKLDGILEGYPDIKATFNLTPSLIRQLDDLSAGATDLYWDHTLVPAEELTDEQKQFILDRFFDTNRVIIARFPRYQELLDLRDGSDDALNDYTADDYRDLQLLFNLAWTDPDWLAEGRRDRRTLRATMCRSIPSLPPRGREAPTGLRHRHRSPREATAVLMSMRPSPRPSPRRQAGRAQEEHRWRWAVPTTRAGPRRSGPGRNATLSTTRQARESSTGRRVNARSCPRRDQSRGGRMRP